jgi:hypothetical protein
LTQKIVNADKTYNSKKNHPGITVTQATQNTEPDEQVVKKTKEIASALYTTKTGQKIKMKSSVRNGASDLLMKGSAAVVGNYIGAQIDA